MEKKDFDKDECERKILELELTNKDIDRILTKCFKKELHEIKLGETKKEVIEKYVNYITRDTWAKIYTLIRLMVIFTTFFMIVMGYSIFNIVIEALLVVVNTWSITTSFSWSVKKAKLKDVELDAEAFLREAIRQKLGLKITDESVIIPVSKEEFEKELKELEEDNNV